MIGVLCYKNKIKEIIFLFLSFILFELFLFGSGQPLSISGGTVRMFFYVIAMLLTFLFIAFGAKTKKEEIFIAFVFIILLFFSSFVGLINGAGIDNIISDFMPMLYFLLILFFSYLSTDLKFLYLWTSILKKSTILLTFGYIVFFILMYTSVISFPLAYQYLSSDSNEIMFRGSDSSSPGIFYKSFIFLVIGFFYFHLCEGFKNKVISFLIFIAIVLTFTRGFYLSVFVVSVYFALLNSNVTKKIFFLIFLILFAVALALYFDLYSIVSRADSDAARFLQFNEVLDMISVSSIFIGHGYGIGTLSRPNNFEITYLEIFHKQGLLGLSFWFGLLFYMSKKFYFLRMKIFIVNPIFAGVLVVYVQTLTNPYLINSMGLGYIALALVSLNTIGRLYESGYYEKSE